MHFWMDFLLDQHFPQPPFCVPCPIPQVFLFFRVSGWWSERCRGKNTGLEVRGQNSNTTLPQLGDLRQIASSLWTSVPTWQLDWMIWLYALRLLVWECLEQNLKWTSAMASPNDLDEALEGTESKEESAQFLLGGFRAPGLQFQWFLGTWNFIGRWSHGLISEYQVTVCGFLFYNVCTVFP